MNLFEIAENNSTHLEAQHTLLTHDGDILRFSSSVSSGWTISINMRQCALNKFLKFGIYKNIYNLTKSEDELESHLGEAYKTRTTFDRTFENGELFKYGALNIGGLGLENYGNYCVMIKRTCARIYSLAFIKEHSFKYVHNGDGVNIRELEQDVADGSHVHMLAAIKHEEDLGDKQDIEWPTMICCNENYIEAITKDEISERHVDRVRVSQNYYNSQYNEYLFNYAYNISDISDDEIYRLGDFKEMQDLLRDKEIELEIIDES